MDKLTKELNIAISDWMICYSGIIQMQKKISGQIREQRYEDAAATRDEIRVAEDKLGNLGVAIYDVRKKIK